ncbi:MAG: GH92 family glycosyl hydrolase [Vicingaceae bacterium]
MRKILFLALAVLVLFGCGSKKEQLANTNAYDLVNPFIGTGGHGHTYPGATMPFGMVQLSPDTRLEGWDGCSGYHNTDSIIYGFSHTHLSGTGVGDYCDVLLMPTQGKVKFDNGFKTGSANGYASWFDKKTEKAKPGYYEVNLAEHDIDVRLTATERVGIHEYTFNKADMSNIILDLLHRDKVLSCDLKMVNDSTIEGHRISKAWAEEQHIYFTMQFSKNVDLVYLTEGKTNLDENGNILSDSTEKAAFRFNTEQGEKLMVKVGISAVSIAGARKNLATEAPHWDFEKYVLDAKTTWTKALDKINVAGGSEDKQEIFYTALYHTMIAPNVFSDVDGKYRGTDLKIHQSTDGPVYTVFSLWDTFRATHPLYTIIEQKKTNEFIRTFLKQYKDGGQLPIWELAANYTGCMIGYHAVPVIVDAFEKGIKEYDANLAMEAMLHSARMDKLGLASYKSKGYIAAGDESESVSKTLEYAYDDWCIAQMAKSMGNGDVYNEFIQRGQYYKNIFNKESGFMQSKMNGAWRTGFDPAEVNFNFTEANSWQYSMFVPQDIDGLIHLHGGAANFDKKLDLLFNTKMELSGRHQVDITGLIGQYAHGNEPSHHMAYLYNYVGKPYKTQERIHQILTEQYTTKPDGLSGNEDCGQMSAWYVLSAMGFYSVTPGTSYYSIGTPLFDEVTINLENGKHFKIVANNVSDKNKYIQSASINGEQLNKSVLYHHQIMEGGELVFEMGETPNKNWGIENMPVPKIEEQHQITPVPYFVAASQTFEKSMEVELKSVEDNTELYYQIEGEEFKKYEQPFVINKTSFIRAYAIKNEKKSFVVQANYKKIIGGRSIELFSEYSNQYNAGGDKALIDNLKGNANYRTGFWQGYQKDAEVIIDLGKPTQISKIAVGALQDIKSWIFYPTSIEIWSATSKNGQYKNLGTIKNDFPDNEYGGFTKEFELKMNASVEAQFVKVKVKNYGVCPAWHLGAGGDAWLFLDEISLE